MSLGTGYFDQMYAAADDPWGLATRWYETRKYALTMALLPDPHYQDAFEPGCSVGVLTGMLASRCGQLLAWDASHAAVRAAAARTAGLPNVCVRRGAIPGDWPAGQFDLIVFSEVLYYFSGRELDRVLDRGITSLRPGGSLLAVHWRHPVADYPRSGDDVHQVLAARRDPWPHAGSRHTETDFTARRCTSRAPTASCSRWPCRPRAWRMTGGGMTGRGEDRGAEDHGGGSSVIAAVGVVIPACDDEEDLLPFLAWPPGCGAGRGTAARPPGPRGRGGRRLLRPDRGGGPGRGSCGAGHRGAERGRRPCRRGGGGAPPDRAA